MPTLERYALLHELGADTDKRLWGATIFEEPFVHAGSRPSEYDRYLGVQDLVMAIEGPRRREFVWIRGDDSAKETSCEVKYGWSMALLEMLVDPLLREWVPRWLRKQFRVWNKGYQTLLQEALEAEDDRNPRDKLMCNRVILEVVHARLIEQDADAKRMKEEEKSAQQAPPETEPVESDGGADGEAADPLEKGIEIREEDGTDALIREELPEAGADDVCGGVEGAEGWGAVSAAERVSGAGPAPAATDRVPGESTVRFAVPGVALINPPGYQWEEENFVDRSRFSQLRRLWDQWRGGDVGYEGEVVRREDLDRYGLGFAHDILE